MKRKMLRASLILIASFLGVVGLGLAGRSQCCGLAGRTVALSAVYYSDRAVAGRLCDNQPPLLAACSAAGPVAKHSILPSSIG